ncbi:RNA-directed DNA polymerase, eukaryota [Tanacetum coccineum]
MRQTKNLMDINIDALYNILKQNQGDVNDAIGYKKKAVVVTLDPLTLVAKKTKVTKSRKKVVVQSKFEGSDDEDMSDYKKITASLQNIAQKPEYMKSKEKKEYKKSDEKKRDMSKVKCYNFKKEGHFAKDCEKAKEIRANMVFMAKMEKVLSNLEESLPFAKETIAEVSYYSSDYENFHDAIESTSENFNENHIVSQKDHDESKVDHNDSEEKDHLVDKFIKTFNQKIAKSDINKQQKTNQNDKTEAWKWKDCAKSSQSFQKMPSQSQYRRISSHTEPELKNTI